MPQGRGGSPLGAFNQSTDKPELMTRLNISHSKLTYILSPLFKVDIVRSLKDRRLWLIFPDSSLTIQLKGKPTQEITVIVQTLDISKHDRNIGVMMLIARYFEGEGGMAWLKGKIDDAQEIKRVQSSVGKHHFQLSLVERLGLLYFKVRAKED